MSYEEIKTKRAKSLVYMTKELIKCGIIDGETYTLNASLVSELIEHYAQDLANLKLRYGIAGRANSAKVAGLMAGVIMRYRPMLPANGKAGLSNYDCNESLAIYHGLALCAIQSDGSIDHEELARFVTMPKFPEWLAKFKYFLRKRNHTPESFIFIFDTIGSFILSSSETNLNTD
jgi:hypothetical protein